MKKIWFITGASKGLGLGLVKYLLANGQFVAATSRKKQELINAVGVDESPKFLPLQVDLTNDNEVEAAIKQASSHFNGLDVVVNNAGYGITGTIEELSMEEVKQNLEINLLATIRVIHYALPFLRKQHSGHIINISSIGGFAGALGWPIYTAAKFAVLGYTEVLAQDVKELGIKATVIAPGGFRTSFLSTENLLIAKNRIEDYTAVHKSQENYHETHGNQMGDPEKAAKVMLELVRNPNPPIVLFIGTDAYNRATQKMKEQRENIENNKNITLSTDFK